MSIFNVTIGVGHPNGDDLSEVSAVVDTGALHSSKCRGLNDKPLVTPFPEDQVGGE